MTLASIKVGDIVHVDKRGRRFFAKVTDASPGLVDSARARCIAIEPVCKEGAAIHYYSATAREVCGIYRKAKGSA